MKTVIEMAKEAGLLTIGTADGSEAVYTWPKGITEEIERFAELVRADERARMATDKSKEAMKLALEALNAAEDLLHRMGMQSSDAYQKIDAAIAKATGGGK